MAAPPRNTPGNGPPTLEKMVFVNYPKNVAPGKPTGSPGGKPDKNQSTALYSYTKVHWPYDAAAAGIDWYYNPTNAPGTFLGAIQDSFNTWDTAGGAGIDFTYIDVSGAVPGENDGVNVVGWGNISTQYPGAIGVTTVWYYRYVKGEKLIVDCDTELNTDVLFAWSEGFPYGDTSKYDVDVQNIMTHEAGHWLMLLDLYDDAASEQTMYGIADELELKKITLESGDIAGIQAIYP